MYDNLNLEGTWQLTKHFSRNYQTWISQQLRKRQVPIFSKAEELNDLTRKIQHFCGAWDLEIKDLDLNYISASC